MASVRPLILVSNDDGYLAPGVRALADCLDTWADAVVVAPERERSAVSHAISLHKPLRVREWGPRRYWCSGSPADAVYLAIHHVLDRLPDLVVTGVNHGFNLGDDTLYSGTVGAAMEGLLHNVPAVAVSVGVNPLHGFEPAASLASRVAEQVVRRGLPARTLLNVNVPSAWRSGDRVRATALGARDYLREVTRAVDPRGREYFWLGGARLGHFDVPGSDCNTVDEGVASVTPVRIEMTDRAYLRTLEEWLPKLEES